MRVRIVEDEPLIVALVRAFLEAEGIEVVNGDHTAALERPTWEGVDAAVIDMGLPGLSGADVLAYLIAEFPEIRRVVFTAFEETTAGTLAHAVIRKPGSPEELLEALRRTDG